MGYSEGYAVDVLRQTTCFANLSFNGLTSTTLPRSFIANMVHELIALQIILMPQKCVVDVMHAKN